MELFVSRFNRLAAESLQNFVLEKAQPVTLIYGPSGVGKTELLRKVYQQYKNPQVLLIDALMFSQNYVWAAQESTLNDFRVHMRNLNLILLDRLELLKGKKHTLEELLHTLDALASQDGKLIVAFQGEPQELSFLNPKLSSRLLGGMTLPIAAPSHDELADYANRYARSRFWALPETILQSIADQTSNLREVQKLIRDFGAFSTAIVENKTDDFNKDYWEAFLNAQRKRNEVELTPENIVRLISELTGVLPHEIRGDSRAKDSLNARRFAVYAIRKLCNWSYPQLGEYFQKAHSAMIKSYRQFDEMMKNDPEWVKKFERLQAYFNEDEG